MNYYNEFDPKAAAWLEELIAEGYLPYGEVDQRSITDVSPTDLSGFAQCHFFAGIGGWSLALALAGWPEDRPVWTGSCPCQPFSSAGKQMGRKDPRHLWPAFRRLINRCRPPVVFGEQVASKDGRKWLAGVFANLETMGYAPAGADLCAAGIGAPQLRQRLWWGALRLAESDCVGGPTRFSRQEQRQEGKSGIADDRRDQEPSGMGDSSSSGLQGCQSRELRGQRRREEGRTTAEPGSSQWAGSRAILCRDGKSRRIPTEPALFPLDDGLSYKLARRGNIRAALLRGAGNAIVPQVAAEFIAAYLETL